MNKGEVEQHRITYGSKVICFQLERRPRRTLEISVCPNLDVEVRAPLNRSLDEILHKVRKRAGWIVEQQYFFSLFMPIQQEKKYFSGETHAYLGRNYRLKVVAAERENVLLKRGSLEVHTRDRHNSTRIKQLLDNWYRERASLVFVEIFDRLFKKDFKGQVAKPIFYLRAMSKRWGSCTRDGRILLNTHLIKAPIYSIEYVIVHELCHFKHHNHSKSFYNLLTQIMPDWEKRKIRLELVPL